jgi:hypothetical protein
MTQPAGLLPTLVPQNGNGFPAWDYFMIGADACPCQAELVEGGSPRGWDERQGYALSGATLVPTGDHLTPVVFRIKMWDPVQWPAWQTFAAKYLNKSVRYNPGTVTPRALSITHPILNAPPWLVSEVVVDDVTVPQQDENGLWTWEIHFHEYRAPQPAPQKPDAAIAAAQEDQPTATDQFEAEMQNLGAQLPALAQQAFQ